MKPVVLFGIELLRFGFAHRLEFSCKWIVLKQTQFENRVLRTGGGGAEMKSLGIFRRFCKIANSDC